MERHEVLAMMTALKASRACAPPTTTSLPTGSSVVIRCSRSSVRCCRSRSPTRRRARSSSQMASARLPTAKELADFDFAASPVNRAPDPGARRRRLPGGQAQHRAGRRHRHRQDPSRRRHRALLHPQGRPGPLLQRRRPGQPPRGRAPAPDARAAPQISSYAATSSSSTNSATCPSPRPAGSCSSTS